MLKKRCFSLLSILVLMLAGMPVWQVGAAPAQLAEPFTQISTGYYHTCGLQTGGIVSCWFLSNRYGQATIPPVDAALVYSQISSGGYHTCGLTSPDGLVVCWGAGAVDTGVDPNLGQSAPPAGSFSQLATGSTYSCALDQYGSMTCWGLNIGGTPAPAGPFADISAGVIHMCARLQSDKSIVCWGDNSYGQQNLPAVTSSPNFTQVSAGAYHTCAINPNLSPEIYCWGQDNHLQTDVPIHANPFVQVSAGGWHTCALDALGAITCWGAGTTSTGIDQNYGQAMPPAGVFTQVSASGNHTCAIKDDGTVVCWGMETILGNTGAAGVTLNYTDGTAKSVTSDGSGNYVLPVSNHWSGSVTPSLAGTTFAPASRMYADVAAIQTGQDYSPIITINSTGAQDGWVRESTRTSSVGGARNAGATTFRVGDDATRRQYVGVLSFATGAALPDTAVITSVTLRMRRSAVVGGGNPLTAFQGFVLDLKNGTFGIPALQAGDFQAAADASYGPFSPAPAGGWYAIDLTGAADNINQLGTGSGLTQIRVRFQLPNNTNAVANYLSLFSGNAAAANRPQLVITYTVP